jgi:hypothetical protein
MIYGCEYTCNVLPSSISPRPTAFDARVARLNGHKIHFALVSRRSRFRAGTRYFKRGVDEEGHVANFNETEQIVTVDSPAGEDTTARMSYVQIRGSIPLFWAEINNLRYMPDLQIMDLQNTVRARSLAYLSWLNVSQADAMRMHLEDQLSNYGPTSLVNLINHKGHEKPIKEAYEKYMSQVEVPDVRYQYFDFHSECSRMRWNRISLLLDSMDGDLNSQGYFHVDAAQDTPVKLQKGVIRTNCMDNLDRTNVSQAAFARWNLDKQLKAVGVLSENDSIALHEDLDSIFRIRECAFNLGWMSSDGTAQCGPTMQILSQQPTAARRLSRLTSPVLASVPVGALSRTSRNRRCDTSRTTTSTGLAR